MKKHNQHNTQESFLAKWLEGSISDTELKKRVSDEDYLNYQKIKKGILIYDELEKPLDDSFRIIQQKIQNKPKVRKLNLKWIASIAALFLFFVGFYQFLGNDKVLNSTGFGEQKTVALLDGSEVILNAKSAISYSKKDWKSKRTVYLNGEALFKVKKGSTFIVKTKNGSITVLGTQFSVKSTPKYFEVFCYEGRVSVIQKNKTITLLSAEFYRNIKGLKELKNTHAIKTPTWINGESSFRSVPLKYVIADFEKQYQVKIDTSKVDTNVSFTGSFTHYDIETALKTTFSALNINYVKAKKNKIILNK